MNMRLARYDLFTVVMLALSLLLSACVAAPTGAPGSAATAMPAAQATGIPTPLAQPGTPTPVTVPAPAALLNARQALAERLQLKPADVTVISYQEVEWPDACLGIETPGQMCAEVITPGYVVHLEAKGQRYEYHTDATGDNVQLASAPQTQIPDAAIVWTGTDEPCQSARISRVAIGFGPCGGPLTEGAYAPEVEADRQGQYQDLTTTYAPFTAETPAGALEFAGEGTTVATPAEQRMIAEWARRVAAEAAGGRTDAQDGLLLTWHREGGLKGFCNDLEVYADGRAFATSCKGNQPVELGRRRLSADELQQLYAWTDMYRSFEFGRKDPATADAMTIRLVFTGTGAAEAPEVEVQAMLQFAAALYDSIGDTVK